MRGNRNCTVASAREVVGAPDRERLTARGRSKRLHCGTRGCRGPARPTLQPGSSDAGPDPSSRLRIRAQPSAAGELQLGLPASELARPAAQRAAATSQTIRRVADQRRLGLVRGAPVPTAATRANAAARNKVSAKSPTRTPRAPHRRVLGRRRTRRFDRATTSATGKCGRPGRTRGGGGGSAYTQRPEEVQPPDRRRPGSRPRRRDHRSAMVSSPSSRPGARPARRQPRPRRRAARGTRAWRTGRLPSLRTAGSTSPSDGHSKAASPGSRGR